MTPLTRADTRAPTRHHRALRVLVVVLALAVGWSVWLFHPVAAQAASYRYWTYWAGDSGTWAFSAIGAARRPPDGAVEGWRFEVSPAATSSEPPRTAASFAAICGSEQPAAGMKRVALVLDYGTTTDAPPGEHPPAGIVTACQEVVDDATGYTVLGSVASIRAQGGLVCGIGGYPATGCGEAVSDPAPGPSPSHSRAGGGSGGPAGGDGATGTGSTATADASSASTTRDGSQGSPGPAHHARPAATPTPPGPAATDAAASASASATADADSASTGSTGSEPGPAGMLVGLGVVALIAAAALVVARGRV